MINLNSRQKEKLDNMFYAKPLQTKEFEQTKEEKKKRKEREKRIKEVNKNKIKEQEAFDLDTETVIGMTNKNNKVKREQIKKQIDKQERLKLKRKKRIKRVIKWTSLICIIAGGITFALVSPIFNIQEIEVTGNVLVKADTIVSLSGLSKNQNIFKFITQQIRTKIKEEPYVENVKINRIFPNKVKIEIEERQRDFNIEFMNKYAYINNQGYILEIAEKKLDNLITIQGLNTSEDKIEPGNRLNENDLQRLETVIEIVSRWSANQDVTQKITSIDVSDNQNYAMYIEEEKKKIYLGDKTNLGDKILWAQAIMNDNKGIEGEIFVDGNLNGGDRPRFRQKV